MLSNTRKHASSNKLIIYKIQNRPNLSAKESLRFFLVEKFVNASDIQLPPIFRKVLLPREASVLFDGINVA